MRMLTVNGKQKFPSHAQLLQGNAVPIDIVARAAAGFDNAAHQTQVIIALQIMFSQPAHQIRHVNQMEGHIDFSAITPLPYQTGIAALSHSKHQRINQN